MSLTRTVALATLLALVAACGGGGDDDGDAAERRATTTSTTEASATGDDTAAATTTTAGGGGDAGGDAGAGSGSGAASAGGDGAAPTTAAPAGGSQAPGPATPGTYHYRMTGSAKFGPTTQTVDETSALVVDPPEGNRQRSVQRTSQGSTTSVFEYRADGVFLAELIVEQAGMRFRFAPNPPVLAVPLPPTAGQAWAFDMTSDDGCLATHTDAKVGATDEPVDVGGRRLSTVRIELATTTKPTGKANCPALNATQTSTISASPEVRLVARERDVTKGTLGGLAFSSDVTAVLQSTTPA